MKFLYDEFLSWVKLVVKFFRVSQGADQDLLCKTLLLQEGAHPTVLHDAGLFKFILIEHSQGAQTSVILLYLLPGRLGWYLLSL